MEEKINEVKKMLENIINEINEKKIPKLQRENIVFKENKDSISFFVYGSIILKLFIQKQLTFEVREISQDDIKKLVELEKESLRKITKEVFEDKFSKVSKREGNINYIKCNLESLDNIYQAKEEIKDIYYYLFLLAPVESFGCCSKYIECSDAKKCINLDKKMAQGCQYKENLKNGKIFYGKNKNCRR